MNFELLYAGNSFNYGALTMTANVIGYLHRKIKNSNFFIGANSLIDVERLIQESDGANIINSQVKMTIPSDWKNYPLKFLKNKLIDHNKSILKNNPDCVIVLGGDDLSEYYDQWRISFDLINLWLLHRHTKVFVIGQTIGPFYLYRKALSRFCLKNIPIYVRDPNNSKYLKNELRIMHSIEASDLAFLQMPLENHSAYNLQDYNLLENKYITIVPSGLRYKYTSNEESYIKEWLKIVEYTLKQYPDEKVVLLPHVLHPKAVDDRNIIQKICHAIKNARLIPLTKEMLASEARFLLSNGYMTITGRMHASISTFVGNKPAIALSYSVKYAGIIGLDLGMTDLIIEAKDDYLWNSGKISKMVVEKMEFIEKNYMLLVERISLRIPELKRKAKIQIDAIESQLTD